MIKANSVDAIMIKTLRMAIISSLSRDPVRGLTSPIKMIRVMRTAICPTTLLEVLIPLFRKIRITPAITGISAVKLGLSDEKYPHVPKRISSIALTRLAVCDFIY